MQSAILNSILFGRPVVNTGVTSEQSLEVSLSFAVPDVLGCTNLCTHVPAARGKAR
jgi:hypothetical protein